MTIILYITLTSDHPHLLHSWVQLQRKGHRRWPGNLLFCFSLYHIVQTIIDSSIRSALLLINPKFCPVCLLNLAWIWPNFHSRCLTLVWVLIVALPQPPRDRSSIDFHPSPFSLTIHPDANAGAIALEEQSSHIMLLCETLLFVCCPWWAELLNTSQKNPALLSRRAFPCAVSFFWVVFSAFSELTPFIHL